MAEQHQRDEGTHRFASDARLLLDLVQRGVDLRGKARVQELLRLLLGSGEGHLLSVIVEGDVVFSSRRVVGHLLLVVVRLLLLELDVVEARRLR